MEISVELTLLPLQKDFEPPIKSFIQQLRNSDFEVIENPLSTQIYGAFETLMPFLTQQVKTTFEGCDHVVLQMKVVKSNRSQYVPNF